MDTKPLYQLDAITVLDVLGKDAEKIVHNLVTNEIKTLASGQGRECFVTDVKGKTLGHVLIFRTEGGFRLIGPAGQSQRLAAHIDRYTIVEDATPEVRDDDFTAVVVPPEYVSQMNLEANSDDTLLATEVGNSDMWAYGAPWLGAGSIVNLIKNTQFDQAMQTMVQLGYQVCETDQFHHRRTLAGFPWIGTDFGENNLPQEVNRDEVAISFTKGCYLGQETVARLDAMGQVQKKLVCWSLRGSIPEPPVEVKSDDKTVGRLTSIAITADNQAAAIGIARRSHFDPGSQATTPEPSVQFIAEVK